MAYSPEEGGSFWDTTKLQQLADEHPYYALAQLDLLKSFDSNRTPAFHQQAAKTALFFSNTYWLSWQLNNGSDDEEVVVDAITPGDGKEEPHYIPDEEPLENTPPKVAPPIEIPVPEVEEKPAEPELPSEPEMPSEPDIPSEPAVSAEPLPAIEAAATIEPGAEINEPLAFEPLHTRDYFASQGIKLSEEAISNDKLGKQVKSFTAWLKTMKKIHTEKLPVGDEQTDRTIQTIAAESNSETEVLTESMAEVFTKQGKTSKAIEVYSKLSLLNPSKSAYFAAKIENLKAN